MLTCVLRDFQMAQRQGAARSTPSGS